MTVESIACQSNGLQSLIIAGQSNGLESLLLLFWGLWNVIPNTRIVRPTPNQQNPWCVVFCIFTFENFGPKNGAIIQIIKR